MIIDMEIRKKDRKKLMVEERYYSMNRYVRERFGKKLYKLALDAGMTCPNRDGTLGTRGCIFCAEEGSGEFSAKYRKKMAEQIAEARERVSKKAGGNAGYIAYFQSFTNTYAPVETLRKIFFSAAEQPGIDVISIATRPDCVGEDVAELLAELAEKKPVWVELGLQSAREDTAAYIRRGYGNEVYAEAVKRLNKKGIEVITHVIIGLPGETKEDILGSVKYAYECGSRGIKLQLLHILKGSDLAEEYEKGRVSVLSMEEYFEILEYVLERTPKDMVIHRLTGDGPKKILIAPQWSADKKNVLNRMREFFEAHDMIQGKYDTEEKK